MESEKVPPENDPSTATGSKEHDNNNNNNNNNNKNDEHSEINRTEEPSSSSLSVHDTTTNDNKDKYGHEDDDNNNKISSPQQEQPPKEVEPTEDNNEEPQTTTSTTKEDGPTLEQKATILAVEDGTTPATSAEIIAAAPDATATGDKEAAAVSDPTNSTTTTAATKQALAATLEEDNHNFEGFKSFPEKLMSLLDSDELKEHIWWLPDGDSFAFIPEGFADAVLNVHFQGTRLESFTRKLNRWGFRRVAGSKVPKNTLAYYHHDFSRGKPDGLKMMTGSNKRAQIMKQKTAEKKSKVDNSLTKADVNATLGYVVAPTATAYVVPQVLGHNVAQGSAFTPAAFTDPSLAGHPYDPHSIMAVQYYQSQHRRAAAEMALVQEREALLEAELQRMRALRQVGYGAVPQPFTNPQQPSLAPPMNGTQNDDSYNMSQQSEDQPNVRPV